MSIHPHPGTSPEADRVLLAALCAVVLTYLVQEVYSLDVWWHLAIGRDILATRSVPRLDQYAAAALGRPYHDSHWLFQVLLASAYRAASWVGVQILQASIWVGALVCTYRAARLWGGVSLSAALTFLAAMACVERFLPRPDSVTVLLVAAFYLLLSGTGMPHRRRAATLAILQVAWVNSHGLFILGPMMAGAYLLEALWPGRKSVAESWKPALTTFLVVLLATLVTPYGVGAWRYAALLLTEVSAPGLVSGLGELSPTFGPAARSSPAFWFFLALLGVTGVGALTAAARRAPVSPARALIVVAMLVAALTGRRNVVLFAVVAAPFAAETLAHTFARRRPSPWITGLLAVGMVAWGWLPLSGRFYLRMELPTRAGFGVTPSFFPHGLPTFLEDIGFRGNVLNSNTLGGFLTFHRHPESFPLTDGRWEIYDPGLVQGLLAATRTEGMWRGVAREFDVQGILLAHTSPEARAMLPDLARDENWRLAYLDRAASFWLPAAASKAAAVDPGGVLGTPPGRYEDAVLLAVFFEATGDSDLRVAALRQALPFAWRTTWILEQIGPLLIELQRYAEAEETYHRLVELEPANAGALNELAFLSYVRGDLDRALGYIEEAVRLRPEDQEFRENLRRVTAARSPSGGDPRP